MVPEPLLLVPQEQEPVAVLTHDQVPEHVAVILTRDQAPEHVVVLITEVLTGTLVTKDAVITVVQTFRDQVPVPGQEPVLHRDQAEAVRLKKAGLPKEERGNFLTMNAYTF